MSADRREREFVDDRHDSDEIDPYGVIPEGFVQAWNATSIAEALRKAERAPSTTDGGEFRRCPGCDSIRIRSKSGTREMPHKREEAFKCTGCGEHFDTPAESREDARVGEQATLPGVRDR